MQSSDTIRRQSRNLPLRNADPTACPLHHCPARRVGIQKPAVELTQQHRRENQAAVMLRCLVLLGGIAALVAGGLVTAQSWMPVRAHDRTPPQPLARPPEPASIHSEKTGTGFFVDDSGNMLTAHHAAEGCTRIVVVKEGRAVAARVVALAPSVDLAPVPKTMGLAAVFPRNVTATVNDMVFAAAYDALPPNDRTRRHARQRDRDQERQR
jgi:S1-C subfamily serine protease